MKELDGQVALVTGGSRGIGLAIAQEFGLAGAEVAVVGRNGEAAEAAAASLEGAGHRGYGCDVSDAEGAKAVVGKVEEELGPIEILVNNAGITRDNIFIRMKEEEWDEVLAVNLKGAFNMTRALARGMMKRRSGVILNITSVVGIVGNAGQANYAASKAGPHRIYEEHREGARAAGDPLQRDRAGLHHDRHDGRAARGRSGRATNSDSARSFWRSWRRGWAGALSCGTRGPLHYRPGRRGRRRDGHLG